MSTAAPKQERASGGRVVQAPMQAGSPAEGLWGRCHHHGPTSICRLPQPTPQPSQLLLGRVGAEYSEGFSM